MVEKMYNINGRPGAGAANTGGLVRYSFMLSNASWHAWFQTNSTPFFIRREKGWHLPDILAINYIVSLEASQFLEVGIKTSLFWNKNLNLLYIIRSPPDDTPKKHFRGFIFRLPKEEKTCRKSAKWSTSLRLFTARSST